MSVLAEEVSVFLPVAGHADSIRDRFADDPATWLPESRPCGRRRWIVSLSVGEIPTPVEIVLGPAHAGHKVTTTWRSLSWRAVPVRDRPCPSGLPELTGELGLYTRNEHASLVLTGDLDPGTVTARYRASAEAQRAGEAAISFLEEVARSLGRVPAAA